MTDLRMYVVYYDALDYPGKYVTRGSTVSRAGQINDVHPLAVADTLEEARAAVPPESGYRMDRDPEDEPHIVEVWL